MAEVPLERPCATSSVLGNSTALASLWCALRINNLGLIRVSRQSYSNVGIAKRRKVLLTRQTAHQHCSVCYFLVAVSVVLVAVSFVAATSLSTGRIVLRILKMEVGVYKRGLHGFAKCSSGRKRIISVSKAHLFMSQRDNRVYGCRTPSWNRTCHERDESHTGQGRNERNGINGRNVEQH